MKILKNICGMIPGIALSVVIATVAKIIESLLPIHIIGASVIALFIGMIVNHFLKIDCLKSGIKFTSKKILKFAIQFFYIFDC